MGYVPVSDLGVHSNCAEPPPLNHFFGLWTDWNRSSNIVAHTELCSWCFRCKKNCTTTAYRPHSSDWRSYPWITRIIIISSCMSHRTHRATFIACFRNLRVFIWTHNHPHFHLSQIIDAFWEHPYIRSITLLAHGRIVLTSSFPVLFLSCLLPMRYLNPTALYISSLWHPFLALSSKPSITFPHPRVESLTCISYLTIPTPPHILFELFLSTPATYFFVFTLCAVRYSSGSPPDICFSQVTVFRFV